MKREFLQSIQVAEQPLPKAVIDAIMAENGRDIENAKIPPERYTEMEQELSRLREQTPEGALAEQQAYWQGQLRAAEERYQEQLTELQFQNALENAISSAHGRNAKAITALLDIPALQAAPDREQAIGKALDSLKRSDGYLFERQTPPPYASGTGTQNRAQESSSMTLAGALREKMERK